jgi:phosphoribosyl-ATP pyrophosphohydrolase
MKKNKIVSYKIIKIEKKVEEKTVTIVLTPERSKIPDWIIDELSDIFYSIVTIKIKERKK